MNLHVFTCVLPYVTRTICLYFVGETEEGRIVSEQISYSP